MIRKETLMILKFFIKHKVYYLLMFQYIYNLNLFKKYLNIIIIVENFLHNNDWIIQLYMRMKEIVYFCRINSRRNTKIDEWIPVYYYIVKSFVQWKFIVIMQYTLYEFMSIIRYICLLLIWEDVNKYQYIISK